MILLMVSCLFTSLSSVLIEKSSATSNCGTYNDGLDLIRQEIGLLKDENQNQKTEMALLRETMESKDRKFHHQIDQLAKELGQRMDDFQRESPTVESKNQHLSSENVRKSRGERPARLLPLQLLYNRKKNDMEMELSRRFYGPPTNCSDLTKLGYTLNGFYLVKPNSSTVNDSSNVDAIDTSNVETIYCAFKQQDGTFNSSNVETRSSNSIIRSNYTKNRYGGGAHFHFRSRRGYFYPFPNNSIHSEFLEVKIPEKVLNLLEEGYFNENNSTFTAPKIGVYQFFFNGAMKCRWDDPSTAKNLRGINLNMNSQIVGYALYNLALIDRTDPKKDIVVPGMIAATLKLNRGDQVYLKAYLGISKGCGLQDLTFIGSLLQDMDH